MHSSLDINPFYSSPSSSKPSSLSPLSLCPFFRTTLITHTPTHKEPGTHPKSHNPRHQKAQNPEHENGKIAFIFSFFFFANFCNATLCRYRMSRHVFPKLIALQPGNCKYRSCIRYQINYRYTVLIRSLKAV